VKPASTSWRLLPQKTWRDSLPTDVLLSAVSALVVVLPSLEAPEELMNYPVFLLLHQNPHSYSQRRHKKKEVH
jgi:hypothetical protein